MAEILDSGHVVTDEDVDTARLIMELDRASGPPDGLLHAAGGRNPAGRVRPVLAEAPSGPTVPAPTVTPAGGRGRSPAP